MPAPNLSMPPAPEIAPETVEEELGTLIFPVLVKVKVSVIVAATISRIPPVKSMSEVLPRLLSLETLKVPSLHVVVPE